MEKITVGLVLFGTKYLKESLPSLIDQDYKDIEFIFIDQEEGVHSAYEYIKNELPEIFDKVTILKGKNLWHSGGHNAIISMMKGDYYFCCSADMLYQKDFVSTMHKKLIENPKFSVATCKIKQWDFKKNKKTNKIDSFGMGIRKHHHFYDIGQGEEDNGQYKDLKEIFGVSGALAIFTKKALSSIRYENEYFDKNIHYKNDVDLSYRLQWAGNRALLIQDLTVYHDRQTAKNSKKSTSIRKSSFFGERILMKKNFYENYPFAIKLQTKIYHYIKNFYLLTQVPTLFQEIRKLRELKNEIERKTQAVNKNEISMKRIIELMT